MLRASDVVNEAERYIGYRESGNNRTEFGKEFGWNGVAWCQIFQTIMAKRAFKKAGSPEPRAHASALVPWTASCLNAVAWFKSRSQFNQTPKVGSQVFYGPGGGTHVELVTAVREDSITTIGGNTAGTLNGVYHNGNGVYRKTIRRNDPKIYGYGHPRYTAEQNPVTQPIYGPPKYPGRDFKLGSKSRFLIKWQKRMSRRGWAIAADGVFGPQTLGVVQAFQRQAGLAPDGVIGPKTWAAAWSLPIT
ncbi:peptidoglycan-binding protein [Streptosporangium canum]|uniref:peptidoglycan-binding protein n=1 Tax=Streptosporangium canum TaxID=324952 RepID=UPI0033ADE3BA